MSTRATREPLWFCHECHAESRPLMMPDPRCASCQSDFVEKLENEEDDPRQFQAAAGDNEFEGANPFGPMLFGFSQMMSASPPRRTPHPEPPIRSAPSPRPTSPGRGTGSGGGVRFEMHAGGPGGTRTWVLGGPNTLRRDRRGGGVDGAGDDLPGFMRRSDGPTTPGDISGQRMAQFLMAMMSAGHGGRGMHVGGGVPGGFDPFMLFGPPGGDSGRWGDYAFTQEALDQIMSEIMDQSNANRPVPATDDVMAKLPRETLKAGSPLLEKDCAVCKEQFSLTTEDPEEQTVITLPCKHPFHQPCIVPWLKSSATCPVCRYELVAQPKHHGPAPPAASGSSTSSRTPTSSPPPGGTGSQNSGSTNEGGGILDTILGYIRSSQQPDAGAASSTPGNRDPDVPGGWSEGGGQR